LNEYICPHCNAGHITETQQENDYELTSYSCGHTTRKFRRDIYEPTINISDQVQASIISQLENSSKIIVKESSNNITIEGNNIQISVNNSSNISINLQGKNLNDTISIDTFLEKLPKLDREIDGNANISEKEKVKLHELIHVISKKLENRPNGKGFKQFFSYIKSMINSKQWIFSGGSFILNIIRLLLETRDN
jgi:hypothetical protein